jgi:hypothetical protein
MRLPAPCRYIDSRSGSAAEPSASSSAADATADHSTCVAAFTIGQVALLRAAKPPSSLTLLLQTLTAHRFLSGPAAGASQAVHSSQMMPSQLQPDSTAAAGAPAAQATQQQQQPGEGLEPAAASEQQAPGVGGAGGRLVPTCVQAHVWISLGKVCLVDEGLAKKVVPLFVQVSCGSHCAAWVGLGSILEACIPCCQNALQPCLRCSCAYSLRAATSANKVSVEGSEANRSHVSSCLAVVCRSLAAPPSLLCATISWLRCQTCSSSTRHWWTHICRAWLAA